MNSTRILAAAGAALLLAGCGTTLLESKKIDYRTTAKLPSLEVPPDLTQPGLDGRYAIPEAKGSATYSSYSSERAAGQMKSGQAGVMPSSEKMRIERAGTQRWLVVSGSPDRVWPLVKEFWIQTGLAVATENAAAGVMETEWAENRAKIPQGIVRNALGKVLDGLYSTPERDKFRTRLERGTGDTTEIYISHRGMYEIYINEGRTDTRWQPRSSDPELEAEMLQRLMVKLGADEGRASAAVAGAGATADKAKLSVAYADGPSVIDLDEAFDRAWRRVGLALDRVGFTVEDRDRSKGFYFVRYIDPGLDSVKKDDKSFWSKLAFWRSDKTDAADKPQYRVLVKAKGDGAQVSVQTKDGAPDTSESARKILGLLLEQLK